MQSNRPPEGRLYLLRGLAGQPEVNNHRPVLELRAQSVSVLAHASGFIHTFSSHASQAHNAASLSAGWIDQIPVTTRGAE